MEIICLLMIIGVAIGEFVAGISEFDRQCEPIRIELCRNIGYNETSMPNLAGNEIQSEAEYTLQSFAPLIDYVCSSQLKLFLCATYVPMCTPKAPVPIGPCRTLCESVRSRCDPVLQGFGYLWPPALDCNRFPKENNQETMCMEGPGETTESQQFGDTYSVLSPIKVTPHQTMVTVVPTLECPGNSKLFVKLHRSWRCAPLCHASILFGPNEKHKAEIWANTWTYTALGLGLIAVACLLLSETNTSNSDAQTRVLSPLMWSHLMVAIGWTVRFAAGRTAASCGYDPQLPNVSLLLIDGLSNGTCATTFLLRYYFGMAAASWWAILCLGWHRDVRRNSQDTINSLNAGDVYNNVNTSSVTMKSYRGKNVYKTNGNITTSNLAKFMAWGLPAFQTAAVIVARIIDADELLGTCFVGNQSEKGLQILVATPLFCYWIFGSMNLASGYLVHRRNKEIVHTTDSLMLQNKCNISGSFLIMYCLPFATLLMAVIYEFANIDVWINLSPYIASRKPFIVYRETPMWPFMTKTFMELLLPIICSAWILVPKVLSIYKNRVPKFSKSKTSSIKTPSVQAQSYVGNSLQSTSKSYSTVSYQSVRQQTNLPITHGKSHRNCGIVLKHYHDPLSQHNKIVQKQSPQSYINYFGKNRANVVYQFDDETIL
ncbi:frizzled 4 [Haematobia irritans]|uniref:frizzled 4 n=1 Tax=Haematobia irritans TaxID=7368 RepID=UPI003F4FA938